MEKIIQDAESRMKKSVANLKEELATVRTGRATPALFDRITVEYYGQQSPLNQVASISAPEPRLIVIQPWDKSVLGEIEKAIQNSDLSLNPVNDGKVLRINIPPLTEERRKEYIKMAKNTAEQAKVAVRNIRRDANESLKKAEKNGDISEDEFKKGEEKIQKLTDKYVEEISKLLEAKEKEIMED
ncbi:ribosome recycling factor [Spirochaetia bacterium 38H-sp]|uniref:Ribosome-recycling factor n=1 Tax=Rarispira pelagica TaxID=3141764 RepID=A0ABU9UBZ8_9SPIR